MTVLEQTPEQMELHLIRNFPLSDPKKHVTFNPSYPESRFFMTIDGIRFVSVILSRDAIYSLNNKLRILCYESC